MSVSHSFSPPTQLVFCHSPIDLIETELQQTFDILDSQHTGSLNRHDIKCAVIYLLGYTPSKLEIQSLFSREKAADGLTREQFIRVFTNKILQQAPYDYLRQLFSAFDEHDQGFIRQREFIQIAQQINGNLPVSVLESLFCVADEDGNGLVSYREFERIMRRSST